MPKVILTITYEIHPEKREGYLELVNEMKEHFIGYLQKNYSVYELMGKKNTFAEIYLCDSIEEYEALEDNQDDKAQELIARLFDEFVKSGKAKYVTLVEST
ncbi:MAG TPA: hypothetical protein VIH68_01520 [Bacteroidota bacterium]